MVPVEVYSIQYCPFCTAAKNLLQDKGVSFTDHDLSDLPDREMKEKLQALCGRTTVPQIWVGEKHIGGYTDLASLEQTGELDQLLSP